MRFIHGLEAVDVHHRQAKALAAADAALVLLLHQFLHVALVDQAGEFVARGVFAQARQGLRQFGPLQARPVAHAAQAAGQHRHRRHHRGHQQEVAELDGQRVSARVVHRHEGHRRTEEQHGIEAEPAHLPRRDDEHAEHQDHHHHRKHRTAASAQQRVGDRATGQRKEHLRHGQGRLGPQARTAAADDREEDPHAHQCDHRPQRHRPCGRHADPDKVVHGGHTGSHHQHRQAGLHQAHTLHRVGGQQGINDTAHRQQAFNRFGMSMARGRRA